MKIKSSLKRIISSVIVSVMILSAAPQVPVQNNVATVKAAQVKLSTKKVTLKKGQKKQISLKNAEGKVTWKSKNSKVVTVARGLIRAKKAGKTTVVATYNNKKYKCTVIVTDPNSGRSNSGSGNSGSANSSGGSGGNTGSSPENTAQQNPSTVYWTPGGSVYHKSRSCPTLSRSTTVYSGSISSSGKSRGCQVCF